MLIVLGHRRWEEVESYGLENILAQYADASDEYFGIPLYWLLRSKPYVEVGEGIRLRFFGSQDSRE
jgi:hypothetical protein